MSVVEHARQEGLHKGLEQVESVREQAFEQGSKQAKTEAARKLLRNGASIELVSQSLDMTIEELKALKDN